MIVLLYFIAFFNLSENDYIQKIYAEESNVITIAEESLKEYPQSFNINLNSGYILLKQKKYEKAQKYYKRAYEIYKDIEALLGLTYTQYELKQYDSLIESTNEYINTTEQPNEYILTRRGYSFYYLFEYEKSIECLKKINNKSKDIITLIDYIEPKLSFNIIPAGGMISYDDKNIKKSFAYCGIYPSLMYDKYSASFGYSQGVLSYKDETTKDLNQYEYDIGLKYGRKHLFFAHYKYIDLNDLTGMVYFGGYGLNLLNYGLETSFAFSDYDNFKVYQGEVIPYIWLFHNYVKAGFGGGYKYFDVKYLKSSYFVKSYITYFAAKFMTFNIDLIYNQKTYFVSNYGFISDNSGDDITGYLNGSVSFKINKFILSPYYQIYLMKVRQKGLSNKQSYGISAGFTY